LLNLRLNPSILYAVPSTSIPAVATGITTSLSIVVGVTFCSSVIVGILARCLAASAGKVDAGSDATMIATSGSPFASMSTAEYSPGL